MSRVVASRCESLRVVASRCESLRVVALQSFPADWHLTWRFARCLPFLARVASAFGGSASRAIHGCSNAIARTFLILPFYSFHAKVGTTCRFSLVNCAMRYTAMWCDSFFLTADHVSYKKSGLVNMSWVGHNYCRFLPFTLPLIFCIVFNVIQARFHH